MHSEYKKQIHHGAIKRYPAVVFASVLVIHYTLGIFLTECILRADILFF